MCIKSRQRGLQTSHVFSQTARSTDDLAAINSSGRKLELAGAVDKWLGQVFFLAGKGRVHLFNDATHKGQAQKWALWILVPCLWTSTSLHDPPCFVAWTTDTSYPSYLHRRGVAGEGLGRHVICWWLWLLQSVGSSVMSRTQPHTWEKTSNQVIS